MNGGASPTPPARWLAARRTAITHLDPSRQDRSSDADILPLLGLVDGARIVAIGESVHHVHEFALLRHRLVRLLVERAGFDTIVLEAVRPGPNPLDAFVRGGGGDAECALVAANARMWRNRETASLLSWIAGWNREGRRRPVRIAGMDILAPGECMRRVTGAIPIEASDHLNALSRGFDDNGLQDQTFFNRLSPDDRAFLQNSFGKAQERLTGALRHRYGADTGPIEQQVRVVLQALEALAAGQGDWESSVKIRDEAMAENVLRLIADEPERRAILLSHNSHVAAAGDGAPLGMHLRQRLANAYVAIGTTFGEARFDPPIYGVTAAPGACRESIDQHIAGPSPFLLDLRPPLPEALAGAVRLQTIVPGAPAYLRFDPISDAFDMLAFLPHLGNAQALGVCDFSLDVAAVDAAARLAAESKG